MAMTLTSAVIELKKLLSRRKYIVLLIIQLSICLAAMIGVAVATQNFLDFVANTDEASTSIIQSISSLSVDIFPISALSVLLSIIIPLFVFMMASDSFAHELEDGTIRCSLLRPISRAKIFISKMLAIWFFAIINLMLTCLIFASVRVFMDGSGQGLLTIFLSYIFSIVPIMPFVAMASIISIAAKNSTLSMFLSLIVYIMMFAITLVSQTVGAIFFSNHLGFYKQFIGISINFASVGNTFLLIVSSTVILAIGAFLLFDRKQV